MSRRIAALLPMLVACGSSAPAVEAPPRQRAPAPAFRCVIHGSWIEGDGEATDEAGLGQGFDSRAEETSARSQAEACARARSQVCPDVPDCFLRIDGLSFADLRLLVQRDEAPRSLPPSTPRAEGWSCEVGVHVTVGATEATARGRDFAEATRAARVEGCRALGHERECEDTERFVLTPRTGSIRPPPGDAEATVLVSERELRVGHGRSEASKLEACRAAIADVCGGARCAEETDVVSFDGLPAPHR